MKEIADNAAMFYKEPVIEPEAFAQHVTDAVRPALADLRTALADVEWSKEAILAAFKAMLARTSSRCRNSRCRCACSWRARRTRRRSMRC